jgi:hypothetical protein
MNKSEIPSSNERSASEQNFPFSLQALIGVVSVGIVAGLGFGARIPGFLMFGIYVLPFIAIICCCIGKVRGFGCGLLLGLGLALLILGAICANALSNL